MPVGGLVSRAARRFLPSLFRAGKAGAFEEWSIPVQQVLRNRGGKAGNEIAWALRSSRNISRRAHGAYLANAGKELASLTPVENEQLAQGIS